MIAEKTFKYKTITTLESRKKISADLLSNKQFENHALVIVEPYSLTEKLQEAKDFEQYDLRYPG